MKKAALVFLFAMLLVGRAYAAAPAESSAACILIEAESGRTLYEKNADEAMLIASTTKIATALVVLQSCAPEDVVQIRPEWTGVEGSSMYLISGACYSVSELLAGLMLSSGNDAAVALACHTAGTVGDFAVRMNQLAGALGCERTHFTNPSGLDDEQHYSCARDLARLACCAMENETLRAIFSSRSLTFDGRTYYNHNKLLGCCEGVFGLKTGYTMAAGRTLVSCCEREGMTLVCVTLNDRDDWNDHAALYDWGYENWRMETLSPPEQLVALVGGQTETLCVCAGETAAAPICGEDEISYSYELPRFVFAPVRAGERVGTAHVCVNGVCAASIPLLAARDALPAETTSPLGFLKNIGRIYTF